MNQRKYYEDHIACPECHGTGLIETTTAGWMTFSDGTFINPNRAYCHSCGWRGKEDDLMPEEK